MAADRGCRQAPPPAPGEGMEEQEGAAEAWAISALRGRRRSSPWRRRGRNGPRSRKAKGGKRIRNKDAGQRLNCNRAVPLEQDRGQP